MVLLLCGWSEVQVYVYIVVIFGRHMVKCIFGKQVVTVWSGLIVLRMVLRGRLV